MGHGNIENPEKEYHLEITFLEKQNCMFVSNICKKYDINFKLIHSKNKYTIYLKDSDDISNFLALIESNKGVLLFEDIRVTKEVKNNVNRLVNCETANLNKIIKASVDQINDIEFIKKMRKFDKLSPELREIADLRQKNPDLGLKELGELLDKPLGKSGVSHRLKKIHQYAEELRKN